ncbi:MAG: YkgJ family cysteine cluster protein [Fimbriiglobus sp.]
MVRPLSREYPCVFGAPVLSQVDPRLFQLTYFGHCMDCTFCHDACCQYGADTEMPRVAALEKYQAELEAYLNMPRSEWFREDPEDFGILEEPEYPGGLYTRTQVMEMKAGRSQHNEWGCVFLDQDGRGCRIHRFALERGIDVHTIKPMVCLLFPASFSQGVLTPAYEFDIEDELICEGPGPTIYEMARPDILWYFGPELVAELDAMAPEYPRIEKKPHPSLSLPVVSQNG